MISNIESQETASQHKLRVVIADDETAICSLLSDVVVYAGHEVVGVARDGMEAIQAVDDTQPDVLVMDVLMPRMNGIEAMRHIASAGKVKRILLISGEYRSLGVTVDQILTQGANAFLEKPFGVSALIGLLDKWASELKQKGDNR